LNEQHDTIDPTCDPHKLIIDLLKPPSEQPHINSNKIKECLLVQQKNKNLNESSLSLDYKTCQENNNHKEISLKSFSFLQGD
jgi:hypothetical protein